MGILVGHFLTRAEAAHRARIGMHELVHRPDLLHLGGTWLEEVYFAFQFDGGGVRHDLGGVVRMLRKTFDDLTIADWLARPNSELRSLTPLQWVRTGGDARHLTSASKKSGPEAIEVEAPPTTGS